jgi:AcrR family transcriptional regulator
VPFRYFPGRTALLTAEAEQAMDRLIAEINKRLLQRMARIP